MASVFRELWDDHDDGAMRMLLGKVENELNEGDDDEAVWRRQDFEFRRLLACRAEGLLHVALPVLTKQFGVLLGVDVQRDHFLGKPRGKFNCVARNAAPAFDGNNGNGRLARIRRVDGNPGKGEDLYRMVVAADRAEKNNRPRDEEQPNPSAFHGFRNQHDHDRYASDECAHTIDETAPYPMLT